MLMAEQHERRARTAARTRDSRGSPVRTPGEAAHRARESLAELIGHPPEGVSAVSHADGDGWLVDVDVLEVPRIPDTTSLLATYEVELDADGELRRYRRTRRYRRGSGDDCHG
jgi:Gas vesicle synthesis protein GvpO